jgi:hypothetical protein
MPFSLGALLLFGVVGVLMGTGFLLETLRHPRSRFASRNGRFAALFILLLALMNFGLSIQNVQSQSDLAARRQQLGLPPNPPNLMPVWLVGCMVFLLLTGMAFVATEVVLLLRRRPQSAPLEH